MSAIQEHSIPGPTAPACRANHPTHPWWQCTLALGHLGDHTAERDGAAAFAVWVD